MKHTIKRELQVMFSRETQPLWFRILKWTVFLSVGYRLRGTKWLRRWVTAIGLAGMTLHLVYRWKTAAWTRSWGGWHYS